MSKTHVACKYDVQVKHVRLIFYQSECFAKLMTGNRNINARVLLQRLWNPAVQFENSAVRIWTRLRFIFQPNRYFREMLYKKFELKYMLKKLELLKIIIYGISQAIVGYGPTALAGILPHQDAFQDQVYSLKRMISIDSHTLIYNCNVQSVLQFV